METLLTMQVDKEEMNSKNVLIGRLEERIEALSNQITNSEKNVAHLTKMYKDKVMALKMLDQRNVSLQQEMMIASVKTLDLEKELERLKEELRVKNEKIMHQQCTNASLNKTLIEKDKAQIMEAKEKQELKIKIKELTLALATRDRDVEKITLDLLKSQDGMEDLVLKTINLQKNSLEELNKITKEQTFILQKMKEKIPDNLISFLEKQESNILTRKEKYQLQQQLSTAELHVYELEKEKTALEAKIVEMNQLVTLLKIDGYSTLNGQLDDITLHTAN